MAEYAALTEEARRSGARIFFADEAHLWDSRPVWASPLFLPTAYKTKNARPGVPSGRVDKELFMKAVIGLLLLLTVTLLSACSNEPTPEPTATPPTETPVLATDVSAPEPTPSPAPTATATPEPTQIPPPAFSLDVTSETTWGEVIDALAPQEQDCIHDNTNGVTLVELSYLTVMTDSHLVEEWRPSLIYCLAPDTARALLLSSMLIFLEPVLTESGFTRTEDHEPCLREAVSDVDVGKIWIAKDDEAEQEVHIRIITCFPEFIAASIVESLEMGVDLSEEERGCVQEWSERVDWEAVGESQGYDGAAFMAILPGLADCSPDLVLNLVLQESGTGFMLSDLSDEELGCLREWVTTLDWASIPAGGEEGMAALASANNLFLCVPLVDLPTPEPPPIHTNESLIWHFPTEGWSVSAPTVVDGVVYFGPVDHHVYALDAAAGDLLWSFETGDAVWPTPTVAGDVVYVGSDDDYVYALNRETGEPLWKYDTGDWIEYSPRVSNGIVYILSEPYEEREFQALDGTTGDLLWAAEMPYAKLPPVVIGGSVYVLSSGKLADEFQALDASSGEQLWVLNIEGVEYQPVVTGGTVYFTGWDTAYAVEEATGELLWSYDAKRGPTNSSVVVEDGVCYFAPDGYIYALDATTGEVLWSYSDDYLIPMTPTVAEGLVYVGTYPLPRAGQFHALDAATGETVWSRGPLSDYLQSLAVVDGVLYAEGQNGLLRALEASSGEKDLWEVHNEGYLVDGSYTVADGVVYVGSVGGSGSSGGVYAFTAPLAGD